MRGVNFLVLIALFQWACASKSMRYKEKPQDQKLNQLSAQLGAQKKENIKLQEENAILRALAGLGDVGNAQNNNYRGENSVQASSAVSVAAATKESSDLATDLVTNVDPSSAYENGTEDFLYQEVRRAFREKNHSKLHRTIRILALRFPQSHYLDDATFLAAYLDLKDGQIAEALSLFDEIITKYPASSKVASSLLGKALAYKKLNLQDQSQMVFEDLIKKYPSSKEASKAQKYLGTHASAKGLTRTLE